MSVATRSQTVTLYNQAPNGDQIRTPNVKLTMCVSIHKGSWPVVVQGYGINEARFKTLEDVYNTFCRLLAPIKLDNGGCAEIEACLEELGLNQQRKT